MMQSIHSKLRSYYSQLNEVTEKLDQDQLLVASELTPFQKSIAKDMVKSGLLEDMDERVYATHDVPTDDMLMRQLILGQGIYTGDTALYLWELSENFPYTIEMAVRMGYQAPSRRYPDWTQNVQFKQVREPRLSEDVREISVPDTTRKIQVYSPERVLVEMVKSPDHDIEAIKFGFNQYLKSSQKDLGTLLEVAERLNVLEKIQSLVGILL